MEDQGLVTEVGGECGAERARKEHLGNRGHRFPPYLQEPVWRAAKRVRGATE